MASSCRKWHYQASPQAAAVAMFKSGAFVACHAGPGDLQHIREGPWEPASPADAALYASIRRTVSAFASGGPGEATPMPPASVARTVTFCPAPAHTSFLGSTLSSKAALFVKVRERTVGPVGAFVTGEVGDGRPPLCLPAANTSPLPPPFILSTSVSLSPGGGSWVTFMHHTLTVDAAAGGGSVITFSGAPVLPRWVGGALKAKGRVVVERLFSTSAGQALAWLAGQLGEGQDGDEDKEEVVLVEAAASARPSSASSMHGGEGEDGDRRTGGGGAKAGGASASPRRTPHATLAATLGACFSSARTLRRPLLLLGGAGKAVVTVDGDHFWDAPEE